MVRRIKKIIKGKVTRERKKIIVVGTEGKNKTETQYLRNLERKQASYHFVFAEGNETDPLKIVNNTIKKAKKEELSYKDGDLAISIFDLDLDHSKLSQLLEAKDLSKTKNIKIITSNPCFEIWYLEHFIYTSKPFNNSNELVSELKKYIHNYQKNEDYFKELFPNTNQAIINCKRLDFYHIENKQDNKLEFNNPRTDFYKLVELIISNINI